jgi:glucosylceramidase
MKSHITQRALMISALIAVSMSLCAQTDGKKMKVFLSAANQNEMLVEQQDIVLQQDIETENLLICIYPEFKYQRMLGFGAAFTEASAVNFTMLTPAQKQKIMELYFSKSGIGLNFCRTHINSCDYSTEDYVYVEDGDIELKTFSIDRERRDVMPMIKAALKTNSDLWLFASPWSPPAWMKDTKKVTQGGRLLPEYWQTWANYFSRYLEEYKKEGVEFFGVSIQNEAKAVQTFESCVWTGKEEALFAVNFLRPTLEKNGFGETKIMIWDHNKERVMERARESFSVPGADKAIWGVAHHWYSGDHFDNLRMAHELFPDKPLVATENMTGGPIVGGVNYWNTVERYAKETIMDFNNFTSAIVAWNMILDQYGGPIHNVTRKNNPPVATPPTAGGGVPIVFDTDKKEFTVRASYYTIGHFSKFIKRGAVRIGSSTYNDGVKAVAFLNPDSEIVVVVLNTNERGATPKIRLNNCTATFNLPGKSLQTLIIPPLGSNW